MNGIPANNQDPPLRPAFNLLVIAVFAVIILANWALSTVLVPVVFPDYVVRWHTAVELLCIAIAFFTFFVAWIGHRYELPFFSFLGIWFLLVGLFDVVHVLTYSEHNLLNTDPDLSTWFWLLGRTVEAFIFLWFALGTRKTVPRQVHLLIIVLIFLGSSLLLFTVPNLPLLFVPGQGVTPLKLGWEYTICGIYIAALYLSRRSPWGVRAKNAFTLAMLCTIAAELCLTRNHELSSLWLVLGHNFKVASYWFIFRAVLLSMFQYPLERLRESEERYRLVFENSRDGIMLAGSDGKILSANPAACKMLGRTESELSSVNTRGLIGASQPRLGGVTQYRTELTCVRGDGTEVPLEVSSTLFRDSDGRILSSMILRDVTERKQYEQEMLRLDRLNLVGEMAAGIAHEIRNPMTSARGFLQLLGEKPECRVYRSYFTVITQELDRANVIISEFLSLANNRFVQKEPSNLNTIIESLLPLIEADCIKSDIQVATFFGDIPILALNQNEIRQLLLNLVRNGIEAMDSGVLTIRTYQQNNEVLLEVEDQGTGIPSDVLDKLGTPFFSTKDLGTGLGLAICNSIAQKHDALITVDSGPGGTVFCVRFKVPADLLAQPTNPDQQAC